MKGGGKIGDVVVIRYGAQKVKAKIVEGLGPFGGHGQQLYRIQFKWADSEIKELEVPEDELELATAA